MIKLRDMPNDDELSALSCRYADMDKLSVKACLVLLRLGSDMLEELDAYIRQYDLSQGCFFCLTLMNRDPSQSFSAVQLAEGLGVSSATMTSLLSRLEALGYVERSIDESDRRKLCVQLTSKGLEFLDKMLPRCFCSITKFMGHLSAEEIRQLLAFLTRLSENIDQLKTMNS